MKFLNIFLGAFANFRKAAMHHVCPFAWRNSASTGRIFTKFDIWVFFETLARKWNFH